MENEFVDQHWQKIGSRALEDFRTVALGRKVLQLLETQPGTILDVGCGAGVFTALVSSYGYSALGIDISEAQVQNAHSILVDMGLPTHLVRQYSIDDLIREGRHFDSSVALDVIEHLEDPITFLAKIKEILALSGKLVVSVPAGPNLYNERDRLSGHHLRYDPATLRHQLQMAGFTVARMQYWNFLGWTKSFAKQKILRQKQADLYEFRYSTSLKARLVNSSLTKYFLYIENQLSFPIGLSLLAVARPGNNID